jgi:DUF971 family protein
MPSIPAKLDLKRDEKLEILWPDGNLSVYTLPYLRSMCPCAMCKMVRGERDPHDISPGSSAPKKKPLLNILPGNYAQPLSVVHAELVGNYALRIDWSDNHGSGIYSFEYLRSIMPSTAHSSATTVVAPVPPRDCPDTC